MNINFVIKFFLIISLLFYVPIIEKIEDFFENNMKYGIEENLKNMCCKKMKTYCFRMNILFMFCYTLIEILNLYNLIDKNSKKITLYILIFVVCSYKWLVYKLNKLNKINGDEEEKVEKVGEIRDKCSIYFYANFNDVCNGGYDNINEECNMVLYGDIEAGLSKMRISLNSKSTITNDFQTIEGFKLNSYIFNLMIEENEKGFCYYKVLSLIDKKIFLDKLIFYYNTLLADFDDEQTKIFKKVFFSGGMNLNHWIEIMDSCVLENVYDLYVYSYWGEGKNLVSPTKKTSKQTLVRRLGCNGRIVNCIIDNNHIERANINNFNKHGVASNHETYLNTVVLYNGGNVTEEELSELNFHKIFNTFITSLRNLKKNDFEIEGISRTKKETMVVCQKYLSEKLSIKEWSGWKTSNKFTKMKGEVDIIISTYKLVDHCILRPDILNFDAEHFKNKKIEEEKEKLLPKKDQ